MSGTMIARWSRRFVLASAVSLVCWQASTLVGVPQRTAVVLGVYGFVLHTVFGKAYSLIPTYFDRQLAVPWAPGVHFPLATLGTVGLLLEPLPGVPRLVGTAGSLAWGLGVAVFLGAILWTIRANPTGAATGTSEANRSRRRTDRLANAFVPIALGYLALGSYETIAVYTALPPIFDGYPPRISHLLAAGTGAVLVFAIGFRLLPRFLVSTPPRGSLRLVLPAGAVAPILLAGGLHGGWQFHAGAVLQTVAVLGFALSFVVLYLRSDRRRVGFYGVLAGAVSGCLGVALGLLFAFDSLTAALVTAHLRLNVLGFLGLTIVGVAFQFYPPAIGSTPGVSDRTALGVIAALAGGLFVEAIGLAFDAGGTITVGRSVGLLGALGYLYVLGALFYERYG